MALIDVKLMREYREKEFGVKTNLETDFLTRWPVVSLSIAPNGRQWMTISFTKDEWERIKKSVDSQWNNQ